jgi:transcriptional regulator with XRE-family HTH domain
MKMSTGEQIRKYRSMLGWTLKQLSDRSGVDVGTISALEIRSSSRSKYLGPIATALGLSIEQLQDANQDYMPMPRPLAAMEPAAPYRASPLPSWPFTQINQSDWEALSPHQKSQAEIFIRGMIAAATTQETQKKMAVK